MHRLYYLSLSIYYEHGAAGLRGRAFSWHGAACAFLAMAIPHEAASE